MNEFCSKCGSYSHFHTRFRFTIMDGNMICMECWKEKQKQKTKQINDR
jgi:hypothetical protein